MKLEKYILNEADFDLMGWHDNIIYAISFMNNNELVFDIDYIFKWVKPEAELKHYQFWVSPATLVFENVYNLKFNIEISEPFRLEIDGIQRANPKKPKNADFIKKDIEYNWTIETQQGIISFTSVGFKQYIRQDPILLNSQNIGFELRKEISFHRNYDSTQAVNSAS